MEDNYPEYNEINNQKYSKTISMIFREISYSDKLTKSENENVCDVKDLKRMPDIMADPKYILQKEIYIYLPTIIEEPIVFTGNDELDLDNLNQVQPLKQNLFKESIKNSCDTFFEQQKNNNDLYEQNNNNSNLNICQELKNQTQNQYNLLKNQNYETKNNESKNRKTNINIQKENSLQNNNVSIKTNNINTNYSNYKEQQNLNINNYNYYYNDLLHSKNKKSININNETKSQMAKKYQSKDHILLHYNTLNNQLINQKSSQESLQSYNKKKKLLNNKFNSKNQISNGKLRQLNNNKKSKLTYTLDEGFYDNNNKDENNNGNLFIQHEITDDIINPLSYKEQYYSEIKESNFDKSLFNKYELKESNNKNKSKESGEQIKSNKSNNSRAQPDSLIFEDLPGVKTKSISKKSKSSSFSNSSNKKQSKLINNIQQSNDENQSFDNQSFIQNSFNKSQKSIIFIQYYEAKIKIETNLNITLSQLKSKIYQKMDIKSEKQKLYFKEKELNDDSKYLSYYNINNKSKIQLKDNINYNEEDIIINKDVESQTLTNHNKKIYNTFGELPDPIIGYFQWDSYDTIKKLKYKI